MNLRKKITTLGLASLLALPSCVSPSYDHRTPEQRQENEQRGKEIAGFGLTLLGGGLIGKAIQQGNFGGYLYGRGVRELGENLAQSEQQPPVQQNFYGNKQEQREFKLPDSDELFFVGKLSDLDKLFFVCNEKIDSDKDNSIRFAGIKNFFNTNEKITFVCNTRGMARQHLQFELYDQNNSKIIYNDFIVQDTESYRLLGLEKGVLQPGEYQWHWSINNHPLVIDKIKISSE